MQKLERLLARQNGSALARSGPVPPAEPWTPAHRSCENFYFVTFFNRIGATTVPAKSPKNHPLCGNATFDAVTLFHDPKIMACHCDTILEKFEVWV